MRRPMRPTYTLTDFSWCKTLEAEGLIEKFIPIESSGDCEVMFTCALQV